DIAETFGWLFDANAGVFYIPSWWKWNVPQNNNVLKGNLKDLNEIPPSGLVEAFARNIETLPETFHQMFLEGIRLRLVQPSRTQDQYPDQIHNQEPQRRAPRGSEKQKLRAVPSPDDRLVEVARRTLREYGDQGKDLDTLLDHFHFRFDASHQN